MRAVLAQESEKASGWSMERDFKGPEATLYDIVAYDRASGKKAVVAGCEPIRGRYEAEAERAKMERNNRNPNLSYALEPSRRRPQGELAPESLLTHKFHID
jgi:hypothetical protein